MRNFKHIVFLFVLALFSVSCGQKYSGKKAPVAKDGVIDLSDWDFEKDGPVKLDGEWKWWFNNLVDPIIVTENSSQFIQVPSYWNELDEPGTSGEKIGPFGYGSLAVKILLPKKSAQAFDLYNYGVASAYSMFLVERGIVTKILDNGIVGTDSETSFSLYRPSATKLKVSSKQIHLVLYISNFKFRKIGLSLSPKIGSENYFSDQIDFKKARNFIILGIVIFMGIYHFGLFLQRRQDKASFWFALVNFAVAFRLTVVERLTEAFYHDASKYNFSLYYKTEYLAMFLGIIFFQKYLEVLLKEKSFSKIAKLSSAILIVLIIVVSLLEPHLFGPVNNIFQLFIIILMGSNLWLIFRLVRKKLAVARALVFGIIPVILAIINDLLYNQRILNTGQLMSVGFLLFLFAQAFIIAGGFARAKERAEYLSKNLQREVKDQTLSLEISKEAAEEAKKDAELARSISESRRNEAEIAKTEAEKAKKQIEAQSEKLKELDQQKTHFFQNISHELRTPLTLIMNPLEDLRKEYPENQHALLADRNSKRLFRLVNQLLDFQKLKAGKKDINLQLIDLKTFLISCANSFSSVLEKKSIRFDFEAPESKCIIEAELDSLEKIVFNYLSNAAKYTPEFGKISFGYKAICEDMLEIFVQDNGRGMNQEQQKKLFQVFSQVDETSTREFEGTGLGLALVKELAENMGGEVGVNSEPGKGSVFWARFKAFKGEGEIQDLKDFKAKDWLFSDESLPGEAEEENFQSTDLERPELILVVDDLADMRKLIQRSLNQHGFKTIAAANGKKGLEKAVQIKPNLIISDWMMPQMTGPEMIDHLKSETSVQSIPVILLTAKSDEESKKFGTLKGADAYLGKPFDQRELISTVENLLRLKKKETETEIELKAAAKLQRALNSNLKREFKGLKISDYYEPSQKIGGDFLIVKKLSRNSLFYCAGDISGKGPKASLASVYIKGVIEQELEAQALIESHAEMLLANLFMTVNRHMIKDLDNAVFSTFSAGIIIPELKTLYHINGGHPPAFLMSQVAQKSLRPLADPLGINWKEDALEQVSQTEFKRGERLIIFSDSVTELPGHKFNRELIGLGRISKMLKKLNAENPDLDAELLANSILSITENKQYDDDCSILVISFNQ